MRFNQHSDLYGKHAFLSPSTHHWLNYDSQKLAARFHSYRAARRGTDLHALAHEAIRLGVPLDESNEALAMYVNDALQIGMVCEQPLFYSENCFGTADTIWFYENVLRIHDLKTGITPTSMKQLEVYAALFCLEYGIDPTEIVILLRIYQRDDVKESEAIPEAIMSIMDKIIEFDLQIEALKEG